jgi:hypothetical protein
LALFDTNTWTLCSFLMTVHKIQLALCKIGPYFDDQTQDPVPVPRIHTHLHARAIMTNHMTYACFCSTKIIILGRHDSRCKSTATRVKLDSVALRQVCLHNATTGHLVLLHHQAPPLRKQHPHRQLHRLERRQSLPASANQALGEGQSVVALTNKLTTTALRITLRINPSQQPAPT